MAEDEGVLGFDDLVEAAEHKVVAPAVEEYTPTSSYDTSFVTDYGKGFISYGELPFDYLFLGGPKHGSRVTLMGEPGLVKVAVPPKFSVSDDHALTVPMLETVNYVPRKIDMPEQAPVIVYVDSSKLYKYVGHDDGVLALLWSFITHTSGKKKW